MQNQFTGMASQIQALISTLGGMDQSSKNAFAKQLFNSGMYEKDI